MYREIVRGAVGFTGAMLVAALLWTVLGQLLPPLEAALAADHIIIQSIESARVLAPVVAFLAVLVRLVGAATVKTGGV